VSVTVYDVAIVGYGPTGVTMATLLAQQGLSVAALDKYRDVYPAPRAGHLDDEVIRSLQALGVAYELEPEMDEWTCYEYYNADWKMFLKIAVAEGEGPLGWRYHNMFLQPKYEARMRELNAELGVESFLGYEVVDFLEADDCVTLRAREVALDWVEPAEPAPPIAPRGELEITARYVVGCDGVHSPVRSAIGSELEDFGGDRDWLTVHVQLTEDVDMPKCCFEWVNRDRPMAYISPFPERIKLFEFKRLPGETREEIQDPERVREFLRPWLKPDQYEILKANLFWFHSRIAQRWRRDRLMIVGDAAHAMTPKLGQGLCSGFRDVMNLAWKLPRVLRGEAPDELLDTYETERKPHVREFVVGSNELTNAIWAMAENPDRWDEGLVEFDYPHPRLGPGLHGDAPEPAGTISSQPRLPDGRLMDDEIGFRFAVIGERDVVNGVSSQTAEDWKSIDTAILCDAGDEVAQWVASLGARAVILRPDRYILGAASSSNELEVITDRARRLLIRDEVAATS
jgi:3-(3-hydroxy-phenyl)propionate hydroxylase